MTPAPSMVKFPRIFLAVYKRRMKPPRRVARAVAASRRARPAVPRTEDACPSTTWGGPSGVGKTTLAQNLGLAAIGRGHSVRFSSLAALLTDLLRRESLPALERSLRHRYLAPKLLIVDELGYLPCDSRAADLLYNIISRRHETKSVVITTNLPFKQWGTVFPGAACVAALVDRFAQHCHVIDIDADSWRQKSQPSPPKKAK